MSENEPSHDAVLTEIKENLRQQKVAIRNRLYEVIRDAYRVYDEPQEFEAIIRELMEKQSTLKSMYVFFHNLKLLLAENRARLEIDYAYKPPSVRMMFDGLDTTCSISGNHYGPASNLVIEPANIGSVLEKLSS